MAASDVAAACRCVRPTSTSAGTITVPPPMPNNPDNKPETTPTANNVTVTRTLIFLMSPSFLAIDCQCTAVPSIRPLFLRIMAALTARHGKVGSHYLDVENHRVLFPRGLKLILEVVRTPIQTLKKSTTSSTALSPSAPLIPWSRRGYRLTVQLGIISP